MTIRVPVSLSILSLRFSYDKLYETYENLKLKLLSETGIGFTRFSFDADKRKLRGTQGVASALRLHI